MLQCCCLITSLLIFAEFKVNILYMDPGGLKRIVSFSPLSFTPFFVFFFSLQQLENLTCYILDYTSILFCF